MAQGVGYWQNDIVYIEGPFVICGGPVGASTGRIECEYKGHITSVLPHSSIRPIIAEYKAKFPNANKECVVDYLNEQVWAGRIVCDTDGIWKTKAV